MISILFQIPVFSTDVYLVIIRFVLIGTFVYMYLWYCTHDGDMYIKSVEAWQLFVSFDSNLYVLVENFN
jgi:hypothetical protein